MAIYRTMNKIFLTLLIILSCRFLMADELEDIYENILIKYAKIKFYEADFEQENYWKEIDISQTSYGKVYFDVDNFLMLYEQPENQFLLFQNDDVTIYDSASNQAMISNNMDIELRPVNLISEYWENSEKKLEFVLDNLIKISLTTENNNKISLILADYLLEEILIYDQDDNFVLYKFKNAQINQELPSNIFEIELPEDANLIDNRN